MKQETITKWKKWGFWIALIVLLSVLGIQAYLYIFYGDTWLDETEYLYLGQQIYERDVTLYDEIWSRVPPLLHYVYGFSQTLIGPSFEMGRLFSLIFVSFFLTVLFFTVKKTTGSRYTALLALALIILNQKALSFLLRASPYPLSFLFLSLSVGVLTMTIRDSIKFPLSFFFASLLLMTRMNLFPYFIVLFVYMVGYMILMHRRNMLAIGASLLVSLATMFACVGKFLLINPRNTLLGIFAPFTIYLYPSLLYGTSVGKEPFLYSVYELFKAFNTLGVLLILLTPLLVFLALKTKKEDYLSWEFYRTNHWMIFLILSFLSLFLTHFWANDTYVIYTMPLLAIIVSTGVQKMLDSVRQIPIAKTLLLAFIVGGLVFSLSTFTILGFASPLAKENDITRSQRSGAVIANLTEPDATIFIADNEIAQLLYANRKTFPPMTERYYLFTVDNNTPAVKATNRFNMEILNNHLANESDYILIQSNRGWLKLNKPPVLEKINPLIEDQLQKNYEHIIDIPNALPKKYEYENGTISLYKRVNKQKKR